MKRGVKRQTEEPARAEDSPEKKTRINDNLLKFEQMKKEADENRRRVRDQYLKEQEEAKNNPASSTARRETIAAVPSTRTPKTRRQSTSGDGNTAFISTSVSQFISHVSFLILIVLQPQQNLLLQQRSPPRHLLL